MDKIAKGMSEAGHKAPGCCDQSSRPKKGFTETVKEKAKETAEKVRSFFAGIGEKRKGYR